MTRRRPAEGYDKRRPGTRNYPSRPSVKQDSRSAATTTRKPDTAAGKATGTKKAKRPVAPPEAAAQARRRAQTRRRETVRTAATAIAGGGPVVAAARFGTRQATKRLPKVKVDTRTTQRAWDFGSRAARTSGKALSRWWSGY